jgi:hypothetical protein
VLEAVTFWLAAAGWALLTLLLLATLLPGSMGRARPQLALATGAVVACHALLVWHLRFEWDPARAWEKGPLVFLSFHLALVLILLLGLLPLRGGRWALLVLPAWVLVAPGATAAPLRYPFLSHLTVPLLATTLLGLLVLVEAGRRRLRRTRAA